MHTQQNIFSTVIVLIGFLLAITTTFTHHIPHSFDIVQRHPLARHTKYVHYWLHWHWLSFVDLVGVEPTCWLLADGLATILGVVTPPADLCRSSVRLINCLCRGRASSSHTRQAHVCREP